MKKIYSKELLLAVIVLIFTVNPLFSKPKTKVPYTKYIHPRIYEFDLTDSENPVNLILNHSTETYSCFADFTKYIKEDLPQKGDKIVFYYNGKSSRDCPAIYAALFDNTEKNTTADLKKNKKNNTKSAASNKTEKDDTKINTNNVNTNNDGNNSENTESTNQVNKNTMIPLAVQNKRLFAISTKKDQSFTGSVVFILDEDVKNSMVLQLYTDKDESENKLEQINFKFERLVSSTDTVKEAADEKKAVKAKQEIITVSAEIDAAEELAAIKASEDSIFRTENLRKQKILDEKAFKEAEKKEQEKLAAEQAKIALEKEEQERIRLEQESIAKALADADSSPVSRYEKEFLNDFMADDDVVVTESQPVEIQLIQNPDEIDELGKTGLMYAAKNGNDWQIRDYIKSGADVNIQDKDGWTALMYAARYQESVSCVNLLIDAGADIKLHNKYNSSALVLASCYNNNPEIIKRLLNYYSVSEKEVLRSMVLLISENQSSEYMLSTKLDVFLETSVPVNAFYDGKTILMYAAKYCNSTKIIKKLLDADAVVYLRSSEGKTAFDYAKENRFLEHDEVYWALNK